MTGQTHLPRHQFPLEQIYFFIKCLVLRSCLSFRGASRVVEEMAEFMGVQWEAPNHTTGRSWLLRIGLYKLWRPKPHANDWVWLIDHTVQIGQERCLVVLGVRLGELPKPGEWLRLEHLELINLLPITHSDKRVVYEQLEQTVAETGVPRAILSDHSGDIQEGVNLFCQAHPATSSLYDISHKAARLLKSRLEKDAHWKEFCTRVGQTKFQAQQTELAFLVPPSQRSKARYMNLEKLLRWARKTLQVLDDQPQAVLEYCSAERLQQKFGWLRDYRDALGQWWEYQDLLNHAIDAVRRYGYSVETERRMAQVLSPRVQSNAGQALRDELVAFVKTESSHVRPGERLPGSSEILESSFGKLKSLEGEYQKGGFTSLILGLGAIVGRLDLDTIRQALISTPLKQVRRWVQDNLGCTVQAKRRLAYAGIAGPSGATKTG